MKQVGVHEAKTNLSKLLQRVIKGEEVIIAKSGHPVAKIIPFPHASKDRVLGMDEGKGWISPDFDETLPDELLKEFEG